MAIDLGIDHLVNVELIGRGGFSAVYAATDRRFDRRIAIKVLNSASITDRDRQRFERECRIVGRLSAHPNVVTVHDAGYTPSGYPYLMMEYVEGGSLGTLLRQQRQIPWHEAVDYVVAVAGALGFAHSQGVLHRDIKPDNILLSGNHPLLTDFGIAQLRDSTYASSTHVTASWLHAPPETFDNQRDERSDIYSLVSTLHALISGKAPFWQDNDESLSPLIKRLLHDPPPATPPALAPEALAEVLQRGLAKNPDDRPQTADELATTLLAIRRREHPGAGAFSVADAQSRTEIGAGAGGRIPSTPEVDQEAPSGNPRVEPDPDTRPAPEYVGQTVEAVTQVGEDPGGRLDSALVRHPYRNRRIAVVLVSLSLLALAGLGGFWLRARESDEGPPNTTAPRSELDGSEGSDALLSLARSQYQAEEYQAALETLDDVIEVGSLSATAFNLRGLTYSAIGQTDRAIEDYDTAVDIDPKFGAAFFNRGRSYAALDEHLSAVLSFTNAIQLDPLDAEALLQRGRSYRELQLELMARKDIEKAISLTEDGTASAPISDVESWRTVAEELD